jgi:hypothetical protein
MNIFRIGLFYLRIYIVSPITLLFLNRVVCPGCGALQRNYAGEYFKCHNYDCGLYNIRVYPNGEVAEG